MTLSRDLNTAVDCARVNASSRGRSILSGPMHATFRSEVAQGEFSLLSPRHASCIREQVRLLAYRFDIEIQQYANSGNHLHLLFKGKSRKGVQDFLRAVGCRVAQLVTGARRGKPFGKFWDALAFTRVIRGYRDFVNTRFYVLKNELEAEGWMDYERKTPAEARRERRSKGSKGRSSSAPFHFPRHFAS